jgi:uncharacterized membrane protein YeaQ/YmgE (transglycosylase-associated protein family)
MEFLGQGWLPVLFFGFLAGLLARALMPKKQKLGLVLTTVLGIAGAVCASWISDQLDLQVAGRLTRFIAAVLGGMGLLWLVAALKGK